MVQKFTDTEAYADECVFFWTSHLVDYISVHIRFDLERYLLNRQNRNFAKRYQFDSQSLNTHTLQYASPIDEYSMMSHREGNSKLEYNAVFRAQLCMITGSRSVK